MVSRRAPAGTQAVVRAIRLLKAFSRERPEMSLAELSDALALSKTTAHRLLAALESEGLVSRDPATGSYRLGHGTVALGARALRANDLRTLVRPELERLAAETGETATFEVLVDDRVLILAEVVGRHLVTAAAEVGTYWPAHATSTGKALLAALPEAECRLLLQPPLARHTAATITDPDKLLRQLGAARRRGYATAVEELEVGAAAVAAPFRGPLGETAGAICVGGPVARIPVGRLPELGRKVRESADRLSLRLHEGSPGPASAPPVV